MSEADLIHRARRGDGAAWETLVQSHQEAVFRLAYLLLGDAGDAEDVAQETFIRAFRFLAQFDTSRRWRPWLFSIAANLARNRRRAAGRYFAHLRRFAYHSPDNITDPEREAARHSNAQALWQAIRQLDPADQEIIYLRYFLELSVDETAEALHVAAGTVKSRLHRALKRLRDQVERDFPALWAERLADE
ncbi:MAG: sigma-70 family RNA polymerase sigma factor [Chloroflexi bacterium]|nr:sigma-70 family RNA polymerase sigma factor [Chloroflexota bacterium]